MNTAEKLKDKLGSYEELAKAAKRTRSSAWRWSLNKNGRVPRDALDNVVRYAKRRKIDLGLTMEDLL